MESGKFQRLKRNTKAVEPQNTCYFDPCGPGVMNIKKDYENKLRALNDTTFFEYYTLYMKFTSKSPLHKNLGLHLLKTGQRVGEFKDRLNW